MLSNLLIDFRYILMYFALFVFFSPLDYTECIYLFLYASILSALIRINL